MWKLVPNILTFARLSLCVVFFLMILHSPHVENPTSFIGLAIVLLVVLGLTDVLDGMAARRWNAASKFGRIMDPLVDKVLVCGTFVCFAVVGVPELWNCSRATLTILQWSAAAILILREGYVMVLWNLAEARGITVTATIPGKAKMFVQSLAIGTVLTQMAYVPSCVWLDWLTVITFTSAVLVTGVSGLLILMVPGCWQARTRTVPVDESVGR